MNEFQYLVDGLILLNKKNRMSDLKKQSSSLNYLMSYCTVHVDIGRKIGKTSYIINNAKSTDLIIVPTPDFKDDIVYKRREKINVVIASNMKYLTKKDFENWDHK